MRPSQTRAVRRSLLAALDATLPLQYRPSRKVILRQLGKDRPEIHLPIPRRTKPSRSIHPSLIPAIDTLPARRTKLRILHVKHLDAAVIEIDEFQIIKLLQHEMARIIKHVASRMIAHSLQKHFKRDPIVQIFARMDFEAQIPSRSIKRLQDRPPPCRQLVKSRLN